MSKTRRHAESNINGIALNYSIVENYSNFKVVSAVLKLSAVPTTSAFFQVVRIRPPGTVTFLLVNIDMATCNLDQYLTTEQFECLKDDRINVLYSNPDLLVVNSEIIIERI